MDFLPQIEITGIKELINRLPPDKADKTIRSSLMLSARYIQHWIQVERLSGRYNLYKGMQGLNAPTGRLRSSISVRDVSKSGDAYMTSIGTNVEYAPKHEFGIGVPKRAFLAPAITDENNIKFVLQKLNEDLNRALRK